jgi:hypothetical protein
MNCKFCEAPIEVREKGRKRKYCNDTCKTKWHYHNNEVYRENQIIRKMEKYYENPEMFCERQKSYEKREDYKGSLKAKEGITWRKHLFDEEEPNKNVSERDPESFMDNLGFGNVSFDFGFTPVNKNKKEGE